MNDMVQAHEERMMHLKRYYPFFRLMDSGLSQYRDGAYERLDMSYIVLAVLLSLIHIFQLLTMNLLSRIPSIRQNSLLRRWVSILAWQDLSALLQR